MTPFRLVVAFMSVAVVMAAAASDSRSAGAQTQKPAARIQIAGEAFQPATLDVRAGTKVTWTNADDDPHTITAHGTFDSGGLAQGDSYSRTFRKPGRYPYFCKVHPFMKGVIVVRAAQS